jgi:hypothetical protein
MLITRQRFLRKRTGWAQFASGVLAVRVLKIPFASNDDGTAGGFDTLSLTRLSGGSN